MKKKKKLLLISFISLVTFALISCFAIAQAFAQNLKIYKGSNDFVWNQPSVDTSKKTVIIVTNNAGTEMFDFFAPFYLFNATEKANVYVVSEKKAPVF